MMRRIVHIALLLLVLLFTGCARESVPALDAPLMRLTVRCHQSSLTKGETQDRDGEQAFNENLIRSIDFLFYSGDSPAADADAIYHVRKELSTDPMQPGSWETTIDMVIKKEVAAFLFNEGNDFKASVYTLVNFDASYIGDLSGTSRNDLAARGRIVTDFAAQESNYIQPYFLMDSEELVVLHFQEHASPNVQADIRVKRFAAKISVAVNVVPEVVLKHDETQVDDPDETWRPVLHTMRIYLVDGVKSVLLSNDGSIPDIDPTDPDPQTYSFGTAQRRPFVNESGNPSLGTETVTALSGDKLYYDTWPMYSYPTAWDNKTLPDHSQIDYTQGLPTEPPYLKLEMDWRRVPDANYTYDRRKYYYKIFMPFDAFKRNNWYSFYVDVSILGAETDEGKAILEPTCYLLDWQNKSLAINKYATISKARYLSVDRTNWEINNMETLSIPFLSSHNVKVIEQSVKATRPYYGEINSEHPLNSYHSTLHGWIRRKDENSYYLDYNGQPEGNEAYEPVNWLTNTSTTINLDHPLFNDYTKSNFDYSPYTISFDINHTDLIEGSHTYTQYLQHITILQRPAIYIECLHNRDTGVIDNHSDHYPYRYNDGTAPWLDKPWGYVYVNGGRYIRWDRKSKTESADPFFTLGTANNKREYQWQTVWYTGGSRDMFDIHVTVLPSNSGFVIGDPREDRVNNLDSKELYPGLYEFTVDGATEDARWHDVTVLETIRSGSTEYPEAAPGVWKRVGFNEADALYGEEARRPLRWYYPTEKSTRTENMLAPSYRIASKFGGTEFGGNFFGDLSKEYAEYRCAGYQEDGLPAGRWRLPTKAEIHFIAQLSAKKAFTMLFSNTTYWSANGAITVNGNAGTVSNSSATAALLRCVYDSWYWDQVDALEGDPRQPDPTIFYWGDKER